jgi:hypothetical protein
MQSLIFRVSWELQFDDWAASAGQSALVELCIETIIVRCGGNCCLCHRRLPDQAKTPAGVRWLQHFRRLGSLGANFPFEPADNCCQLVTRFALCLHPTNAFLISTEADFFIVTNLRLDAVP